MVADNRHVRKPLAHNVMELIITTYVQAECPYFCHQPITTVRKLYLLFSVRRQTHRRRRPQLRRRRDRQIGRRIFRRFQIESVFGPAHRLGALARPEKEERRRQVEKNRAQFRYFR